MMAMTTSNSIKVNPAPDAGWSPRFHGFESCMIDGD
jgi:hypothetical protein